MCIDLTTFSAYTLQSSGVAERMNSTMMDKTRAMGKKAGINETFRDKAVKQAAYLHNWKISSVPNMRTIQVFFVAERSRK